MVESYGKQLRKPSGLFGRMVSIMMNMRNREFYKKIIPELEIKSGDKIYEIGYWPGLGINLIARDRVDCSINGIDFSELMYHNASNRNKKFIDKGIIGLTYGDFLILEDEKERYDKIFCVNVIYFWSDWTRVFEKIYSMLKDQGIYCIFMTPKTEFEKLKFAKDFNKYSIERVESELKKAGFKDVKYKLDTGYYIKSRK